MDYYTLKQLLRDEITQRREEGCDTTGFDAEVASLLPGDIESAEALYAALDNLRPEPSFPYEEPVTLDGIRAARSDGPRRLDCRLDSDALYDRILGAWLGRCAGCTLGKPVEGWTRERIEEYLRVAGSYPLDDYFPVIEPFPEGLALHPNYRETARGYIRYMARDDDIDYTILGLSYFERFGPGFTSDQVADSWLGMLPYHLVYTAERVAYHNLVNGLRPPRSATYRNPYREWIGAQIRADAFGYVAPGLPEVAAEFAYRDAVVSHVKNGVYGEMWVAAMLAAALVSDDLDTVLAAGLAEIPARSRLAEAVRETISARRTYRTWQEAWDALMVRYGHYSVVHTINNAVMVLLGLLYGEMDLGKTISIAVMGGLDTDCNGATAGSIIGALLGARRLPERWVTPLSDRVTSVVVGYHDNRISDLARRTARVAEGLKAR
ncbi:MAG: ADP-ribosylglycohydrolase family protein [Anaerolineae bacterium]|nr:ADP-ribosylglycohydrolase family protein [Anaerolineae bacterium]